MAGLFNSVLLASFWGGGFTVIFLLVNKLFKMKLPVSWHYYIWLVVLLRLLIPVFITVNVEPKQITPIIDGQEVAFPKTYTDNAVLNDTLEIMPIFTESTEKWIDEPTSLPVADSVSILKLVFKLFIFSNLWIAWLFIAALIFSCNILSYMIYTKMLKASNIRPNEDVRRLFKRLAAKKKLDGKVLLFKNKHAQTPFVIGLLNPMVIIPDKDYSLAQLSHIFAHELNHIASHDIAVKWFFEIAKAVHWFNPFVYAASRNASFYCEASCDAVVLKNSDADCKKEYGLTIVEIIAQAVNPKTTVCISMSSKKSDLKERIQYILNGGQNKKSILPIFALSIVTLMLCAFSGVQYKESVYSAQESEANPNVISTGSAVVPVTQRNTATASVKKSTNFLIVGSDNDGYLGHADVMLIVNFNAETNKINLLSVPRDVYFPFSDNVLSTPEQDVNAPNEKISLLKTYAGKENGIEYLKSEISNRLGLQIDYYVKMDMSAFEMVVDAAGGVDMAIPDGGLYYSDPAQDLEIALPGGMQHLDGNEALQLVRYRASYIRGDLDRIDVQQQFVKELYKKIISTDNLLEKATALLTVLVKNTETNLTMSDFAAYTLYIPNISLGSLQTFTMPAEPRLIDSRPYMSINYEEFESSVAGHFR